MIKVWGRRNSINVQKVLWTLAELDLPFERIEAGMAFGVVDTPAYRDKNPNGLVPTIDDDGFVLWESNVIVRYLAARYGMGGLCPEEVTARALAEKWMDWQQTALYPPLAPIFLGLIRHVPEHADPAAIEQARQRVEKSLAVLDAHLADRAHVGGERFTMADIPLGASVYRWLGLPIAREPRPNIERWFASVRARPGFAEHVALPLT